jgi:N-hydroxyarylamine O-acetyltransferase
MSPLDGEQVDAYLARIGVDTRPEPTAGALRRLHWSHLRAVPFENLNIHLGEPISLSLDDLYAKVVGRHRGGFCYELNGLFSALLAALGFEVTLLAASVFGPDGPGPPLDHLALSVDVAGVGPHLVDVGFGRHSAYPLGRDVTADQHDPCGVFRVATTGSGDIEVSRDGEAQYRLEPHPRMLPDFEPTCWWQQTWPGSHFRSGPVCTLLTASAGSVTLAGRRLILSEGGDRTETELESDEAILAAYRDRFGIDLERVPAPVSRS